METTPDPHVVMRRWAPLVLVVGTFVSMVALGWGCWPDPMIDFGHELYVPWRISQGDALVRDLAVGTSGPLSSYVNGLWFRITGPSIAALQVLNVAVAAAVTALLYRILATVTDRFGATAAAIAFLTTCAFGQYVGVSNYNFATPYSHGVTHGMLAALLAIWAAHRWRDESAFRQGALAGLGLGLAFLAKPELFVACGAGLAARLLVLRRAELRRAAAAAAWGALVALAVPAPAFGLLRLQLSADQALRAVAGPWLVAATPITRTPFYLKSMGLDRPWHNAELLAAAAAAFALAAVAFAALDRRVGRLPKAPWIATGTVLAAIVVCTLLGFGPLAAWPHVGRPLPLLAAAGCVAYALRARRAEAPAARARATLGLSFAAFAGALLLKLGLNARLYQYGFALAAPAFALAVAWATATIPALLRSRGGAGTTFRLVACILLAIFSASSVLITGGFLVRKIKKVGSGGDAFQAGDPGVLVNVALRRLQAFPPDRTLAVLPEGAMINYLARRRNPSPYLSLLPDAERAFGEQALVDALRRAPPDLILIVPRDASEHGATRFGGDYGHAAAVWIQGNYELVERIGDSPLEGGDGALLLRRRGPGPG